jgi:DNA-binding XRE family transcriptional regulator
MKYEVEVTVRTVYVVEADSYEEARELAINECGSIRVADEVEDIEVRKLV